MSLKKPTVLAAALLLGLGSHALAAGRQSLSIELNEDTSLAGTKLPAGHYKITWTGSTPETEVKVAKGKKVVATGKAKRVEQAQASDNDAVVSRKDASGAFALSEIHLRGQKEVLVFGSAS